MPSESSELSDLSSEDFSGNSSASSDPSDASSASSDVSDASSESSDPSDPSSDSSDLSDPSSQSLGPDNSSSSSDSSSGESSEEEDPTPPVEKECGMAGGTETTTSTSSSNPVRYSSGQIQYGEVDLESDAFGIPWGHTRSYANILTNNGAGVNGNSWLVQQPKYLTFHDTSAGPNSPARICMVDSASNSLWFARNPANDGTYDAQFGGHQIMIHDAGNAEFVMTDEDGKRIVFFDNGASQPPSLAGRIKAVIGKNGRTITAQYDTETWLLASIVQEEAALSSGYFYEYETSGVNTGRLLTVTLIVNGQRIRRASFVYYSGDSGGNAGDLKTALVEQFDPGKDLWKVISKKHYRYYTLESGTGFIFGLKYVVQGLAYQRMVDSGLNPETAREAELATFADFYFEYDSEHRVSREKVAGGREQFDFAYAANPDAPSFADVNVWNTQTIETLPDGNQNRVYTNKAGQAILKIFLETTGSREWYEYTEYNDRFRVVLSASSFAVASVTEPVINTDNNLVVALKTDEGLIKEQFFFDHDDPVTGAVTGYLERQTVREGSSGERITTRSFEYDTQVAFGLTIHPLRADTVYPTESSDPGDGQRTSYERTWHQAGGDDTFQVQLLTLTFPVVSAAQNGSDSAGIEMQEFDVYGNATWIRNPRGAITFMAYDLANGALIQKIEDVDTTKISGAPAGWSTVAGWGLHLVSDFMNDALGRVTQARGPWHEVQLCECDTEPTSIRRVEFTAYLDENHEVRRASGYMTGEEPTADFHTIGAVRISQMDESGNVIDLIEATRECNCGALNTSEAFAQNCWTRWTHQLFDPWGRVLAKRVYNSIPACGEGQVIANYLETLFGYDLMGRRNRIVAPSGTIERLVYNSRGLLDAAWIGTDDYGATDDDPTGGGATGNNMKLVAGFEYDEGAEGGDGNLTKVTRPVDATSGNDRITTYGYDFRNRRDTETRTDGATTWITKTTYDNLDQITGSTRYHTEVDDANRITQGRTFYDAVRRVYKTETDGCDPADGEVVGTLTGQNWYDLAGNLIKQSKPGNTAFTKTVFDALNRPTVSYLACVPGEVGVPAGDDNDVDDDTVIEQGNVEYDRAGNVLLQTTKKRFDDTTGTGPLCGPHAEETEPKSRDSYVAYWPDAISRPRVTADYGTNGGQLAIRPKVAPARSDTVLVTTRRYKDNGDENAVIDPQGLETRWENDQAGRRIKLIEGLAGTGCAPSSMNGNGPACVSATMPPPATPRITEFCWHSSGQLSKLTLVNAETGNQVTRWIFGTTLADSAIASNSLVRAKIYPESDDRPAPAADGPDGVYARLEYQYNRQGQVTQFKNADGTTHAYEYNKLGGMTNDEVTEIAAGLNSDVMRIGYSYNNRGLTWKVTSYLGNGNVFNEVALEYDAFLQLNADKQDHNGAVSGSTPKVTYSYESGGVKNSIRRVETIYPNGRVVESSYGSADSMDDHLSRVSALKVTGESDELANYSYCGRAWQVRVGYPVPELELTYRALPDAPVGDAGDPYNGYDRFGRTVDMPWVDTGDDSVVERSQYGFDQDSRRTWQKRPLSTTQDQAYQYDELSQVSVAARGSLNLNATAISGIPSLAENWNYDPTGNWRGYRSTANGSPTLDQQRVHDRGNRLTQIKDNPVNLILDRAGRMGQLAPDASGNWSGKLELTWDAWSRITRVKNNGSMAGNYRYDGLHRRTTRLIGSVTTHSYYNDQWRPVEERKGNGTTASISYLWGARHRDDLARRDRAVGGTTLNETRYVLMDYFNPAAITDESGVVMERYAFSAFGVRGILNPDYTPGTESECAFEFAFQGQCLDVESGLYNYGYRYYSPYLGRWLSKEPLGEEASLNLMSFVSNEAINIIDLLGLAGLNLISVNDPSYGYFQSTINKHSGTPVFLVAGHSSEGKLDRAPTMLDDSKADSEGGGESLSVSELAKKIKDTQGQKDKNSGKPTGWDGKSPILLLGCETGKGGAKGELSLAAQLAKELGVPVGGATENYYPPKSIGPNPAEIRKSMTVKGKDGKEVKVSGHPDPSSSAVGGIQWFDKSGSPLGPVVKGPRAGYVVIAPPP